MKQGIKQFKALLAAVLVAGMTILPPAQSLAAGTSETLLGSGTATQESTEESVTEAAEPERDGVTESGVESTEAESPETSSKPETVTETTTEPEPESETKESESTAESTVEETVENYAEEQPDAGEPTVKYHTHIQTYGWENTWRQDGEMSGTNGQSKRLEGIEIKVEDTTLTGDVEYQTHVQTYGWEKNWAKNGGMSGTSGQSKRLEGIRIRLTGELAAAYDIYYQVHVQSIGWLDWAANGEEAGTSGLSRRLEGIRIKLVKKGEAAPGETARPFASLPGVSFTTHMQTYGDQPWVGNGNISGIIGKSRRMEGFAVRMTGDHKLSGSVQYKTHAQTYGWLDRVSDGTYCGTTGESKRLEAVQIQLTGELGNACDIYYRVHVQSAGWLGWAKNGEKAGTEGLGLRVEAIQIVVGGKDMLPYELGGAFKEYTGPGYYDLGGTRYYYSGRANRQSGTGWTRINGERYYLVDGRPVTGWQYIGSYKYYFYGDGRLCQNVDGIIGTQKNYQIRVNKQANCVTIYARDGGNGYIIPVKAMLCSTGDDTPLGTFYTPAKYRWQPMFNGTYVQYATRLGRGLNFLFHSVTYSQNGNNRSLIAYGYNGLGTVRSAGCIRLVCGEAYWVFSRCPIGTEVVVYNSAEPGPFDRPVVPPIPANQTWDPTDPNL